VATSASPGVSVSGDSVSAQLQGALYRLVQLQVTTWVSAQDPLWHPFDPLWHPLDPSGRRPQQQY
jgi:hypothetical protein